jgi:hypothetical protein
MTTTVTKCQTSKHGSMNVDFVVKKWAFILGVQKLHQKGKTPSFFEEFLVTRDI